MTDLAIAEPATPAPTLNRKTGKPLSITKRVADMLDTMIERGLQYQDAAPAVGLSVRQARIALDKPHVLSELRRRKQVFRTAISSANPLRLAQIRDQDDNWAAAVRAIQVLEQIDDDPATNAARNRAPGVVIVIQSAPSHMSHMREIEPKPLILHEAGRVSGVERDE